VRRPGLTLVAALLIAALSTGAAIACSCARYEDAPAQYAQLDLLFVGRVIDVQKRKNEHGYFYYVTRFSVSKTIKGRPDTVRELHHAATPFSMCGVRFEKGATSFVGATVSPDGRAWTSACDMPRFPQDDFERIAQER
jgi:hypothetical protein